MGVVAERKLRPTMSVLVSATPMGATSPLVGDAVAPPHLPKFLLRVKTLVFGPGGGGAAAS
jgi:hypothetical protein